jgi:hypothetical protein
MCRRPLLDALLLPVGRSLYVDVENPMVAPLNPLLWIQYGSMRQRLLRRRRETWVPPVHARAPTQPSTGRALHRRPDPPAPTSLHCTAAIARALKVARPRRRRPARRMRSTARLARASAHMRASRACSGSRQAWPGARTQRQVPGRRAA